MNARVLLVYLVSFLLLGSANRGWGVIVIMVEEVGNDVVIMGSGSVSVEGLNQQGPFYSGSGGLFPSFNRIFLGEAALTMTGPMIQAFSGITDSIRFASPSTNQRYADEHYGDIFGVDNAFIILPAEYESGDSLAGTMIFRNEDLESLGLRAGSYSTAIFADPSVELARLVIVPEPSTLSLLLMSSLLWSRKRNKAIS